MVVAKEILSLKWEFFILSEKNQMISMGRSTCIESLEKIVLLPCLPLCGHLSMIYLEIIL